MVNKCCSVTGLSFAALAKDKCFGCNKKRNSNFYKVRGINPTLDDLKYLPNNAIQIVPGCSQVRRCCSKCRGTIEKVKKSIKRTQQKNDTNDKEKDIDASRSLEVHTRMLIFLKYIIYTDCSYNRSLHSKHSDRLHCKQDT
jgi:hypothetical protein